MKHAGSLLYNEDPGLERSLTAVPNNNEEYKVEDILEKQCDLEREYERILLSIGDSWDGNVAAEEIKKEELSRKFRLETRETFRQLSGLVNEQPKPIPGASLSPALALLDYVVKMKDVTNDKLMTSVEQESMKAEYISEIKGRTEEAEAKQSELEVALAKERDDKETNISFFCGIIMKLKAELQDISASSAKAFSLLRDETERVQTANKLAWEEEKVKRGSNTEKTENELVDSMDKNSTGEEAMRKKKGKMSIEVGSWIDKYDKDIGNLHETIERTRAQYEKERVEREELQRHFDLIDRDLANEREELDRIRKRKEEERKNEFLLMKGAQMIQKLYRGRLARKAALEKKRKKKKKKGKKGKKKK